MARRPGSPGRSHLGGPCGRVPITLLCAAHRLSRQSRHANRPHSPPRPGAFVRGWRLFKRPMARSTLWWRAEVFYSRAIDARTSARFSPTDPGPWMSLKGWVLSVATGCLREAQARRPLFGNELGSGVVVSRPGADLRTADPVAHNLSSGDHRFSGSVQIGIICQYWSIGLCRSESREPTTCPPGT